MNHILLEIIEMISILVLFVIIIFRKKSIRKSSDIKSSDIKKTMKIYSHIRSIIKISNCDFVAFFKYKKDKDKNFITLELIFMVDKNENIKSDYPELPITINKYSLKILNTNDESLHELHKEDENEKEIFKDTAKTYYQNIFIDDLPMGYIILSYDKEYKISDKDQQKITDLIFKIKKLI